MSLNYDPHSTAKLTPRLAEVAGKLGMQIVHILCDEPNAENDDHVGVSFMAMTPFLPRVGDTLKLEDGKYCTVVRICFVLSRVDDFIGLVPNVYATRD